MSVTLQWKGDLKFASRSGDPAIELHSSTPGVTSPTQALGYAVAACMAMDVVHVLQKGRYDLRALAVTFKGTRAESHPRRYTGVHLHFAITGNVPEEAVARAIELSRTTYCSVWNSLKDDIALTTTIAITEN